MDYENPWIYQGLEFTSEMIQGHQGFVYLLENTSNGRKYSQKQRKEKEESVQLLSLTGRITMVLMMS
jgi:hypothetical protein